MKDPSSINQELIEDISFLKQRNKELEATKISEDAAREYSESIINTVREPLIVLDHDLRVVTASRSFYEIFKVNPKETVGELIYDLGNKQWDIPKLRELLETILPQKTTFDDYEVEHDFTTIGKRVMLLNARQIKRVLGKERIILLAIEDITEHKRLENILTESEELYKGVFRTASDGILLLEKFEGKIAHINPAAEKMLGYSTEECIGNKLQDIGFMLDVGDFPATIQALNTSGIINYKDIMVTTKSGHCINSDIYFVNRSSVVQCNIRDTTERRQAETALWESEERLRDIIFSIADWVWEMDKNGYYSYSSQKGFDLFGESREDVIGKTPFDFMPPDEAKRVAAIFSEIVADKAPIKDLENWNIKRNGEKICLLTNGVPMLDEDGNLKGYRGVDKDITSQKLAEEELKQTLEKLRKSLMGTIQALSSTVETRDPYTAGHQKKVSKLASAIAQEMGLSNDIIDIIRMAGIIHDIGKVAVPAEILSRPGKLTDIEMNLIKVHSQTGYDILKDVGLPYPIAEMVLQHHERLDGSGYPNGLKGDMILIEACIIAVADVVEAISSHRPYRPALGIDVALEEIEKNKGVLYNDNVVGVCVKLFQEKGFKFE